MTERTYGDGDGGVTLKEIEVQVCPHSEVFGDIVMGMAAHIRELQTERDHWKANHDNQVKRARVLIDRCDLPLERVKAYEQIGELQAEVGRLEAHCADIERQLAAESPEDISDLIEQELAK